jgi:hypothetical protein
MIQRGAKKKQCKFGSVAIVLILGPDSVIRARRDATPLIIPHLR